MTTWTVYGLTDPNTGGVRYIGVTRNKLKTRVGQHVREAKWDNCQNKRKRDWLRSIGMKPVAVVLDTVTCCVYGAGEAERKWIEQYRANGSDLFNKRHGPPIGFHQGYEPRNHFYPCQACSEVKPRGTQS